MAKSLEEMTDEELLELIKVARTEEKTTDNKPPEKLRVQLNDGTVLEADTPEQLNVLLTERVNSVTNTETETKPQEGPPKPPEFNYKKFADTFLKDPREGLDYLDTVEFGFPARKALPLLVATVGNLSKKVQEMETERFLESNEDYKPSAENRKVMEKILVERGWQPSYQTLQDAFDIATSRGLIKIEKKSENTNTEGPPPRIRGLGTSEQVTPSESELTQAAREMPLEDLRSILVKAGMLRG